MTTALYDRTARRTQAEVEGIVLGCLRGARTPLGAYDIIEKAAAAGSRLVPAQVYRTLGRLGDRRQVHRVTCLSGYVAIDNPVDCLSVCTICRHVSATPAPDILAALLTLGQTTGFRTRAVVLEVLGTCLDCTSSVSSCPGGGWPIVSHTAS